MFEGQTLSYFELMECTSRLAGCLQAGGVEADGVVGLCVEKSIEEVAGMVGIMRSGGAYVPLDPKLPVERLRYLVDQCGCAQVVSQLKFGSVASQLGDVEVLMADEVLYDAGLDMEVSSSGCDGRSLAYVLFTSGSTGKPKGVMMEHGSLTAFLCHESTERGVWSVDI